MNKYELVCVIDAGLSTADIRTTQESIEKTVGTKSILTTDQIGLLPLAYPLNGQTQGYFLSYHVELDPKTIDEIKSTLRLEKGLAKFVFYKMGESEKFLTFSDLQKKFEDQRPTKEEKTTASSEKVEVADKTDTVEQEQAQQEQE